MNSPTDLESEMTLDPPGRIAIVGAGPLGLEAALYGRYLGYEVEVFDKGNIGQNWLARLDAPLPMLPGRCLSPLAVAALKAHDGGLALPGDPTFPMTTSQWIQDGLVRLASTDLLVGRVQTQCEVTAIEWITDEPTAAEGADNDENAEGDEGDSYVDGEVPPDYRLTIQAADGVRTVDAEAVIVAIGNSPPDTIAGYPQLDGSPYLFRIGSSHTGHDEEDLLQGWRDIVRVYASLGGRSGLDLYRPVRS
ncbi:MAG: hypothetical protein ACO1RT_20195 [Planctomycetaceae bacterium]